MRSFILILLLTVFPVVLLSQEERIYTHHSDIVLDTTGVIRVSEKIRVYASGDLFKRGITRALPTSRNDVEGNRIRIDYTILEVHKNGEKESY